MFEKINATESPMLQITLKQHHRHCKDSTNDLRIGFLFLSSNQKKKSAYKMKSNTKHTYNFDFNWDCIVNTPERRVRLQ